MKRQVSAGENEQTSDYWLTLVTTDSLALSLTGFSRQNDAQMHWRVQSRESAE